jgi:hypothetical protein
MSDHKSEKLDQAVTTEYLEDILARAEAGDVMAARDALMSIGHYLSSKNLHSVTGESLPVPEFLRDYLSRAFYRMTNGMNADKALNLKRSGRPNHGHMETRIAAYLVYQGVHEHGLTVLEAAMEAAEFINEKSAKQQLNGLWSGFQGKKVEPESLQDWYYKHLEELKGMAAQR